MSPVDFKHLFMHEMMHVWQYQRGMNIRTRGLVSWAADYSYDLTKNNLSQYSMEQQASIVSDFWLLIKYGFSHYKGIIKYKDYDSSEPVHDLIAKYKKVLRTFPI